MALSNQNFSVTIGKETFSLVEIPQVGTELVEAEKASLLGELDLKSLVDDLGKLGSFIRVAYNGVAGNTDLQIKVQRVGYKITKLTDESAVTVHKFKQTSRSVLQKLKDTFQFLLDGLEEMALENLAALANLAEAMAKAAEELQEKFEEATIDVIDALEDIQKAKGARQDHKKELQKQQDELEVKKQKVQELQKEAIEAKERAEQLYSQAQKREDDALEKEDSLLHFVKDAVGKVFSANSKMVTFNFEEAINTLGTIGEDTAYKQAMRMANAEKMKHLEELQKQRDIRRDAIQQWIEFTQKIKESKNDEGLEEVAIDALHNSIGALKSLSAVMMNAALFWRQMHAHCKSLAERDMQQMIRSSMEYPEEERIKVWTSRAFKSQGIIYYSKWVALDDVCGTYVEQIKQTRKDLYEQLQENPTIEESRKYIRQLGVSFGENLKEAQQEIAKKDTQASEEMKSLEEKNEQLINKKLAI